ncbi:MAG: c-type cytochrome [Akkermansiaceae bacterium]|nr:c-type cytochrome [Akkermansiaceae bacterium]
MKPTALTPIATFLAIRFLAADPTPPHAINFNKLRQEQIEPINSLKSLELLSQALANSSDPTVQASILRGMKIGLEGQSDLPAPPNWTEALNQLTGSDKPEIQLLTRSLNQLFGDQDATAYALLHVGNPSSATDIRQSSLAALLVQNHPKLSTLLPQLLKHEIMRIDAIRAYSKFHDPNAPEFLLENYAKFKHDTQQAVIQTLSTRKDYATALLSALKDKTVPKSHIPAYLARSLTDLLGKPFTAIFGDLKQLSEDKEALFAKYKRLLTPAHLAEANSSRGRAVFQTSCAACHLLYQEGGTIGPDLTGSNRADLDYILLNMIDPSADIPDAYKLVTLKTESGQILVGTVMAEDGQRLTLNSVGQTHTVLKTDLISRKTSTTSMMPEGLLPSLPNQQVLDLVKYLQTQKQVPLSK